MHLIIKYKKETLQSRTDCDVTCEDAKPGLGGLCRDRAHKEMAVPRCGSYSGGGSPSCRRILCDKLDMRTSCKDLLRTQCEAIHQMELIWMHQWAQKFLFDEWTC